MKSETYSDRNFIHCFGHSIQTLACVYQKGNLQRYITLNLEFLLYFYFIKNNEWSNNIFSIHCEKTFMKYFWKVSQVIFDTFNEVDFNLCKHETKLTGLKNAIYIMDTTSFEYLCPESRDL